MAKTRAHHGPSPDACGAGHAEGAYRLCTDACAEGPWNRSCESTTVNRNDFQSVSRERLADARVLLRNRCFGGAYYLAGYAVECALKACIASHVRRYDFPDKRLVDDSYTHDLSKLVRLAGLEEELKKQQSNAEFERNWAVVKDWTETSRYVRTVTRVKARDLYSAIAARRNGVLPWIKQCW